MKQILTPIAFALFSCIGLAQAQPVGPEAIIQQQLDAFQADDFSKAFTFASPTIQHLFGTSRQFESMVKSGYPMVWRPGRVQFLTAKKPEAQRVLITDQAGHLYLLEYQMIKMNGGWRINGVTIVPQAGA